MSAFISIIGYMAFHHYIMRLPPSFDTLLAWAIGCLLGELLIKGFSKARGKDEV